MVYFFEYVIITSFANVMDNKIKELHPDKLAESWVKHYFVILNVMYQIGVFISRSSLHFIQIERIWIMTVLQAINFCFLFWNATTFHFQSLGVLCPVFLFVGIMGGGSYVNVLHNLIDMPTLKQSEKESAVSLSLIFNDTGILLASIVSIVLDT